MPKRPCPFEDDLPPQLKIHVGQKQVDNGVCQEERMKSVYGTEVISTNKLNFDIVILLLLFHIGKTMDLLKEGVKSLSRKLNTSLEMNPADILPPKIQQSCKNKHERNLRQMVLNGKLELSEIDKAAKVSCLLIIRLNILSYAFSFISQKYYSLFTMSFFSRMPDQNTIYANAVE